jgi:hypothetical protein
LKTKIEFFKKFFTPLQPDTYTPGCFFFLANFRIKRADPSHYGRLPFLAFGKKPANPKLEQSASPERSRRI